MSKNYRLGHQPFPEEFKGEKEPLVVRTTMTQIKHANTVDQAYFAQLYKEALTESQESFEDENDESESSELDSLTQHDISMLVNRALARAGNSCKAYRTFGKCDGSIIDGYECLHCVDGRKCINSTEHELDLKMRMVLAREVLRIC